MALIPDFYKNAVVSIGIKNDSGATNWIGTGFLVVRQVDKDGYIPFLVSNKHVFKGKTYSFQNERAGLKQLG